MKNAFTLLEVVFVIVVLGILASVAIPKFAATRVDAQIAKARASIASIRSGIISERQTRLIQGDSAFITGTALNDGGLFNGVLMYPITPGDDNGDWSISATTDAENTYDYKVENTDVRFIYTQGTGIFDCNTTNTTYGTQCQQLVN